MSFNPEKLTVKAGQAIRHAQEMVETRQHRFIRPLHLLKALLDETDGIMKPLLQRIGVNIGQLNNMVDGELDRLPSSTSDEPIGAGPEAVKVLNAAAKAGQRNGRRIHVDRTPVAGTHQSRRPGKATACSKRRQRNRCARST